MSMNKKVKVLVAGAALLSAFAVGRYTTPTKVVEVEKIVYQEKIVEKKVYVKQKEVKKNVITVTLTTIRPDGTKTIEKRVFDKSEIDIVQHGTIEKEKESQKETEKSKVVTNTHDDWMISGLIKFDKGNLETGRAYGVMVNRRIVGPFHLGAFIFNDVTYGGSVGITF